MWYEKIKSNENSKWKYRLLKDMVFPFEFLDNPLLIYSCKGKLLAKIENGELTIFKGFQWDGATFAPDLKCILRATVIHDLLCQLAELTYWPYTRKKGDIWFNRTMKADKVNIIIRLIYFNAVIPFGQIKEKLCGKKRQGQIFFVKVPNFSKNDLQ